MNHPSAGRMDIDRDLRRRISQLFFQSFPTYVIPNPSVSLSDARRQVARGNGHALDDVMRRLVSIVVMTGVAGL